MIAIEGIRGDMVLSARLRYDLAPIPLSFEAKIRVTPETAAGFKDGALIRVNEIDFRIIKSEPVRNAGGGVQGDYPMSAVNVTAFPDGVVNVARGRRAAVIANNSSFSSIYRACGATVSVIGDISVERFACLKGSVPTFQIAKVLQEESAVMAWRNSKVHLMRLRDVMAQEPAESIDIDATEAVQSDFLEADEIPVYISVGDDGKFLSGERRGDAQSVAYSPRKSQRALGMMGRVLVRRRVAKAAPNIGIRAGDLILASGIPLVVMTVAHVIESGSDGGDIDQYSRLWLGSLS